MALTLPPVAILPPVTVPLELKLGADNIPLVIKLPPVMLPTTLTLTPVSAVVLTLPPVILPVADINPPVKIFPPVTLAVALITPVTSTPVEATTTTFEVPLIEIFALPFVEPMLASLVPL